MKQETKAVVVMVGACILILAGIIYASSTSQQNSLTDDKPANQTLLIRNDSWKIDAPQSKVTLVEFMDFECPACSAAYPSIEKIVQDYQGKMTFVVRYFSLHGNSVLAFKSAEAAGEQGKYWQMYSKLFENQEQWAEKRTPQTELFRKYAQGIGLNMDAFNAVIQSTKYEDKIIRDKNDAMTLGVPGTPTFFLNGKMIHGVPNYAQLKDLIDSELAK